MTLNDIIALSNAGFTKADIYNLVNPQAQMDHTPQSQVIQAPQPQVIQTPQPQMMQTPQPQMMQTPQPAPANNHDIDLQLLGIIKQIQGNNLASASAGKPESAIDIGLGLLGNKVE